MQVGFKALADRYGITLAQPLRVDSSIASRRASRENDDQVENQYPPVIGPPMILQGILSSA